MQEEKVLYYLLKRGDPSSLDYAVPINTQITAQRLQCSGKTIKRIEIIFPIRISNPAPFATITSEEGVKERDIEFVEQSANPSKKYFFADVDLLLDGRTMHFMITRDCNIAFYLKD